MLLSYHVYKDPWFEQTSEEGFMSVSVLFAFWRDDNTGRYPGVLKCHMIDAKCSSKACPNIFFEI